MVKRTKLKGVAAPPVLPALPPIPRCVSRADGYRLDIVRVMFELSDDEILESAGEPTGDGYSAPTLRLAAGGGA